jgi:hypothetical protein
MKWPPRTAIWSQNFCENAPSEPRCAAALTSLAELEAAAKDNRIHEPKSLGARCVADRTAQQPSWTTRRQRWRRPNPSLSAGAANS